MNYEYKVLNRVQNPDDLKGLSINELRLLSKELRRFMLYSIAETGGHLSSNLGVVELTVALHYCLNTPADKIVWDVGHQSYAHKILTGRKDRFCTLRQLGGLSGFPKSSESAYDAFDTGHSSTSVSAALGMARARDLSGGKYTVAAVIGDGSMTGGLAYEALNDAGQTDTNILVVLNDNQMSISENVGALSRHLNDIRTAPSYIGVKKDVHSFLDKIPVGEPITRFIERTKDGVKYFFLHGALHGVLFEELGFTYIGPVDGHDLEALIKSLRRCRNVQGPVLLHVHTKKGKGYKRAELSPETFHGINRFSLKTGVCVNRPPETFTQVFGMKIAEMAEKDDRIIGVTASMAAGTGLALFGKKFPDRIFDVGIAEAHAVTFCAGLAKGGCLPVFAVYSSFLQRAYDQILHDVCMQNLPVIFAIDRAGIVGEDGETHQGVFDLSFLSHLPNMTVLAPRNGAELCCMLEYAAQLCSPVAIRYPKGSAYDGCNQEKTPPIEDGKCEYFYGGSDAAIVSVGAMFPVAREVCHKLREDGLDIALINARFVKPISQSLPAELQKYRYVFTLEDNVLTGGFGQALAMRLLNSGIYFHPFALPDTFLPHGSRSELFARNNLDSMSIYTKIKGIINTY